MRRTIRLTGRRQLPRSSVAVTMRDVSGKQVLTCAIRDAQAFKGFPISARLEVRLVENKQVELVDFGTIGSPKHAVDLQNQSFVDPGVQLRVDAVVGQPQLPQLAPRDQPVLRLRHAEPDRGSVRHGRTMHQDGVPPLSSSTASESSA